MVSALSARLMNLQPASGGSSVSSSSGSLNNESKNDSDKSKSESGYSADMETSAIAKPPSHIALHVRHKRHHSGGAAEDAAKRRKLNEVQYAASRAKEDLARAGLACPRMNLSRSRVIPFGQVDMSKVQLKHSKTVGENSPFLTPPSPTRDHHYATDFGNVYTELFVMCSQFYKPKGSVVPPEQADAASDSSSVSVSNLSDAESEESEESPVLVIKARLDDAIDKTIQEDQQTQISNPTSHIISCPSTVSMSIEEALEPCRDARLVTLSSPPFTVVHANAAYARTTGLQADAILGQPLLKLLASSSESSQNKELSLPSCAASSGAGRDTEISLVCQNDSKKENLDKQSNNNDDANKAIKCHMKVSPIVSVVNQPQQKQQDSSKASPTVDVKEVSNVTHYAVDMIVGDSTRQQQGETAVQKHAVVVG